MTPDFRIRPLELGDMALWEPLWRDYLSFYNANLSDAQIALTFSRYCDADRQDMKAWVAVEGGEILGICHVIIHSHGWHEAPVTYLQDLFTAQAARGRGVARGLITKIYEDADKAGRPSVYWMTQEGNATARALYDRIAVKTEFIKYARG